MEYREALTNEILTKRFKSAFELVSYAIKLAQTMVEAGKEPRVRTDCKNLAFQVLAEIAATKNLPEFEAELKKLIPQRKEMLAQRREESRYSKEIR
ncbi:MAG: hypothetical protein K0S07_1029 [Chlamydiales bacterium]|jgi:hypothetical protein|nr:hypothetical protein [Chlamydiales bacterium]